jgi:hypothetical protein
MAASTAETITPRYSAPMIEPPAFTLTKNAPMIDAMIDTPPSTSGYSTAFGPASVAIRPPSSIVAMMVTGVGFEQVGRHAGAVAHVVAHVVRR